MTTSNPLIPVLTTPEGSCLTAKNWEEAGVSRVCYYLSLLLVKPGLDYLKTLPDWQLFSGWTHDWVLNASMPKLNSDRQYVLRSPFDGSSVHCGMGDMVDVILHLKPQQVILPEGFELASNEAWQQLAAISSLYVPASERARYLHHPIHGLYYVVENSQDIAAILAQHPINYPDLDSYVTSHTAGNLPAHGGYIESNQPAKDACSGLVYTEHGTIDLRDKQYAMQFERIDSSCDCPTCEQAFTRAYLHHLLEHTPLLCQRFLIQHNLRGLRDA